MKALIGALLAVAARVAQAQVNPWCLPSPYGSGSVLHSGASKNGAWVWWYCEKQGQLQTVGYVGTVAELSKVGGRMQTIINAADPLKSLQSAGSRFTILPATDPSLSAVTADMQADMKKRGLL